MLTTSPQYVVGVDAMPAVMVGSLLAQMGIEAESEEALQVIPLTAMLVGVWFLIFYLCRAGRIVKYISTPVMGGFISGVGTTIILMQIPKLFGGSPGTGTLVTLTVNIAEQLSLFNPMAFGLGLGTILIIQVCRKRIPKVPVSVLMLVAGALIQAVFHVDRYGVRLLPEVAGGLPGIMFPRVEAIKGYETEVLFESFSISLVVMAQALLVSGNYAVKYGDKLDTNAEMLAYAGMNFASGFCGCTPINGSVSRSAIADALHCRSQIMALTASGTMLLILLVGTPFLRFLPVPVLAGIVVTALLGILEGKLAVRLWKTSKNEWFVFLISFFGVLLSGAVNGVAIGCVLSFFEVAIRAVNPPRSFVGRIPGQGNFYALERNKSASPIKGAVIYRFSGNLFFANIDRFEQEILGALKEDTKCVVVDARGIGSVDVTAVDHLVALAESLKKRNVRFYLTEHVGALNDMIRRLGGEYLLKNGMVRRTITLALRDCGFEKPYELEEVCVSPDQLPADTENSDERLAEMEWAFGAEAKAWLETLAQKAAEALVAGDEASVRELHLNEADEEERLRVRTGWGTLGRFDESAFWDYLEVHLEMLHTEGKISEDTLQKLESRIESRRIRGESSLREFNPHGFEMLREEQRKLREELRDTRPEEFEHIRQLQERIYKELAQK